MQEVNISPVRTKGVGLALGRFKKNVGGQPPRATATTLAYAPTVTSERFALVNAVTATSIGVAGIPQLGIAGSPLITAVRANANALAPISVVTGGANVTAVIATSTSLASSAINPVNGSVAAVIATGTNPARIPTISGEAVLTGGGPGTASAQAIVPTVTTGAPSFVSFDSAAAGTAVANPGSGNIQWTHTASGSNRAVIVAIALSEVAPNGDYNSWNVTTATYGGVAMTAFVAQGSNNSNAGFVMLFKLLNPPTGAQTVSVTFTYATAGTPDVMIGSSASYTGVLSIDGLAGAAGNSNATTDVTSAINSVAYVATVGGSNISVPNQNQRFLNNFSATGEAGHLLVQDAAGAATVNFTATVGDWWGSAGCSLNPF